tara:strand:- start:1674 stop:1940 length:267 start_codon:yes stop_codon:yes gene_type:complete
MTSKGLNMSEEKDWIDDILDDKPIAWWQISKIEGLCQTSSVGQNYVNMNLEELTYEQANQIIYDLKENDNPRDCREQFYKALKRQRGY